MTEHKTSSPDRIGGPGAAHENRKHPEKSRPHAELPHDDAGSGNAATRLQNKILQGSPSELSEKGGYSSVGDTGKDDDLIKPKNRRQVR